MSRVVVCTPHSCDLGLASPRGSPGLRLTGVLLWAPNTLSPRGSAPRNAQGEAPGSRKARPNRQRTGTAAPGGTVAWAWSIDPLAPPPACPRALRGDRRGGDHPSRHTVTVPHFPCCRGTFVPCWSRDSKGSDVTTRCHRRRGALGLWVTVFSFEALLSIPGNNTVWG